MTQTPTTFPIDYFKKQAKQLLRQVEAGDSPGFTRASAVLKDLTDFSLMKAQHVIAVEYGFSKWQELGQATEIQLRLAITMEKESRLTDFGIGVYDERRLTNAEYMPKFEKERQDLRDHHAKVGEIVQWLRKHIAPIKTINTKRTSYGLKHVVEKDLGYITNGQFIAAAIIAGYDYKTYYGRPNVSFAMSERSWKEMGDALKDRRRDYDAEIAAEAKIQAEKVSRVGTFSARLPFGESGAKVGAH